MLLIMSKDISGVRPIALRESSRSIGFTTERILLCEWSNRYFIIASTFSGLQKLNALHILPV